MKKNLFLLLALILIILIGYLIFKQGTVKKSVIDNITLQNKTEKQYTFPSLSKEEKAVNALNLLSASNTGFTEIPEGLKFEKVVFDRATKTALIYASFNGKESPSGSFQESKILLQIFRTVKLNIEDAYKFRITFKGDLSPFSEIKYDGTYMIDGENIVLVEE
jgi:hypothetical protein